MPSDGAFLRTNANNAAREPIPLVNPQRGIFKPRQTPLRARISR